MKYRSGAVAALVAVQGAYAQTTSAPPPAYESAPISYTTVTYETCTSASMETMITVTNGVTVTYCPDCTSGAAPSATPTPGHVTTYTTTYLSLCPTGTVPVTYTVTESCAEATPTWTPGPSHVPQGYTVTVKDCTVCHSDLSKPSTIPVTITEPCNCDANEGTIMPPKSNADATPTGGDSNPAPSGKPVQQISDGQIQNPTGDAPAGTAPAGTGPTDGGSNPPAATGGNSPAPGSDSPAGSAPAGSAPAGTAPAGTAPEGSAPTARPVETAPVGGNGTDGTPPAAYQGAASSSIGIATSAVVIVIGALACLL
ncbi:hypothetical protein TI39_contig4197g00009 [Zymoseptoria brevis]|uniref:Uncharacterized protein n=1 Tax=Zymoseptoria brevis TaxID=1047168 RepID=A0A0F4GAM0_9PEZI|nr:hypothetical protein TI39_contig4197g00009 [Zymoseptoria brevis]